MSDNSTNYLPKDSKSLIIRRTKIRFVIGNVISTEMWITRRGESSTLSKQDAIDINLKSHERRTRKKTEMGDYLRNSICIAISK